MTHQNERYLDISLYFVNPIYVSSNSVADKVRMTFNDPNLFIGKNGAAMEMNATIVERFLPPQILPEGLIVSYAEAV